MATIADLHLVTLSRQSLQTMVKRAGRRLARVSLSDTRTRSKINQARGYFQRLLRDDPFGDHDGYEVRGTYAWWLWLALTLGDGSIGMEIGQQLADE